MGNILNFIKNILGNFKLSSSPKVVEKEAEFVFNPKEIIEKVFNNFDFPKDIYSANKFIFGCFFFPSAPFTLWNSENSKLPENLEILTKIPCQFLMLRCWFWFLSEHHGKVASNMVRDEFYELVREMDTLEPKSKEDTTTLLDLYFNKIDSAIESQINAPIETKTFKSDTGDSVTLPWEYYLALSILITSEDSPYFNKDSTDFDGNEFLIMNCLANSRFLAIETFTKFKEHYVDFDANFLKSWKWLPNSGLYEQHLMRRHNSIFFGENERIVKPNDVYLARCKDIEEWTNYYQSYLKLKKEILDDDAPNDYMDFIFKKREEIDELIDKVDRLGVGKDGLDIDLTRLRESLIDIWKYIYEHNKNSEGLLMLEKAESFNKLHSFKNRPDYINAMGHSSIPASEVISSFLSLSIEELRLCLEYFNSSEYVEYLGSTNQENVALINLRTGALDFSRKHYSSFVESNSLELVKAKLAVIGVAL